MIVITGAAGKTGSGITANLLSRAKKVRCIAKTPEKLQQFVSKGADAAVGSLEDVSFLTEAFSDATAVFTMIPPDYSVLNSVLDFRAYQNKVGASIAEAIEKSGVKCVVNLSSQGAHLPDGTGPIKGLHDQEERLNRLRDVNVLHMRPAYFMENLLMYIPMIKNMNIAGSAINGDLKFAMIATRDVAAAATEHLIKLDFVQKSVRDFLGQRDLSLREAISIIGKRINRPDLKYVQFSYKDARKGLLGAGLSEDMANLFIEMSRALNEGLFAVDVPRTKENTTATSIEEFADTFAEIYYSC